jgi:chitinase
MDFGAYYVNWAQYRKPPYHYDSSSVAELVPVTTRFMFSFVYFCPPADTSPMPYWAVKPFGNCSKDNEYELMWVEPNDNETIANITKMKAAAPKMKVIASIGGWNFPSAFWSKMSATSESRAKFVKSAAAFLQKYKLDGIDIDWEFPTSSARDNAVKISCKQFRTVHDAGGSKDDTQNIVALFKDMRGGMPTASISFAAPANVDHAVLASCKELAAYLDYFHIMTYDYTVSDVPGGTTFAPNCPLYNPPPPANQMSIDYTVQGYLKMGIQPSQIQVGVAYYGHSWWNPTFTSPDQWQKWGGKDGQIQGLCCGPFKQTPGGAPGQGSGQCGSLMYSEMQKAKFTTWFDNVTQSDIAYMEQDSEDGVTKKGVWVTYNDKKSLTAIANYAIKWKLAGVFAYDSSMDTIENGKYTYELSKLIAQTVNAGDMFREPEQPDVSIIDSPNAEEM